MSWRHHVAAEEQADRLLATGYSCQYQASRFDNAVLPRPAQALLDVLRMAKHSKG